jgi:hypothetical protein
MSRKWKESRGGILHGIQQGGKIIPPGCEKTRIAHNHDVRTVDHQAERPISLKRLLLLAIIYLRLQIHYGRHLRRRFRRPWQNFSKNQTQANRNGCEERRSKNR